MTKVQTWKYAALVFFFATVTISTSAQKTNLSGAWKLNLEKSSFGGEHPWPNYELTRTIDQKATEIRQTDNFVHANIVNIPLPDSRFTTEYILDGKERKMTGPIPFPGVPAPEIWVSATWQGGTLLISEASGARGAVTATHRYFLSEDGQQLIELIEKHSTFGDKEQRLVFDKLP